MALEVVRNSVNRQYPSLAPVLYPEKATAITPYASIADMQVVFACLNTSKTPAMGGGNYFPCPRRKGPRKVAVRTVPLLRRTSSVDITAP